MENRGYTSFPPIFLPETLHAPQMHLSFVSSIIRTITMKRYSLLALFICCSAWMFAQNASDVLRYSYLQPGGSARFLGAGSAFGALGAEFGTLSLNPAGLAMFRTDELVVTPSLRFSNADATLEGNASSWDDHKSNFGFDNFGLVFNTTPGSKKWKAFNVGIGLNRMNNYHQSIFYQGSAPGTILNGFFEDANGLTAEEMDPFTSKLAYDAQAIYFQDDILTYDFAGNTAAVLDRSHSVTTTGKMNEMVISFAGNYDEKLFIGATIGVPFVNYHLESEYKESDPGGAVNGNTPYFDNLTYTDFLRTEGVGVNGKFGLIYKVDQMFRVGLALHTPTVLGLTDTYSNTFQYQYTDGNGAQSYDASSPEGKYDYRLRTPWRAIASGAVVFKKFGFLSGDVELVDYTANRFNLTANVASTDNELYERQINSAIHTAYKQTMNVRLGGELALDKFRIRGGVNLLGKPEKNEDGFNTAFTGGVGVRGDAFYIDLGYRRYAGKGSVQAYPNPRSSDLPKSPVASTNVVNNELLLTLGFKF